MQKGHRASRKSKLSHTFSKADPAPRKEHFFFILSASSRVLEIRVWEVFERCILVTNMLLEITVNNCLQPSLFNQNISEVSCDPGWVYSTSVTTAGVSHCYFGFLCCKEELLTF